MTNKYLILKEKYPKFIFHSFETKYLNGDLNIIFNFEIYPKLKFRPKVVIKDLEKKEFSRIEQKYLNTLVFNLGLIEAISYWKATCSPKIEILCGYLNKDQKKWWKDLILNGMGQFFFENQINFLDKNFLTIQTKSSLKFEPFPKKLNSERVLIPIGGGKDSIVTLEYFKKLKKDLVLFSLNPKEHHKKIIQISKVKEKIFVERKIDPLLLKLNKKGFLNGHTPFTAYLSFLSILLGVFKNCKFVAFSNEKSAEEGNVIYLGKVINHQYSKSKEFEEKFRKYTKSYLAKNIEYFSALRNFSDLEISPLFSQFKKYFGVFLSCNKALTLKPKKKLKWCGKCPKCLATFASLYPFLGKKVIQIFKKNLFQDPELLPIMLQLIGKEKFKPFECVGTIEENKLAFKLSLERWKKENKKLPFLLSKFQSIC